MKTKRQTLVIAGRRFVLVEESELRRLERAAGAGKPPPDEEGLPPLPAADADGNRPALEYIRASIARDIIRERRALGLSQQRLAELASVRQETICRLESGLHSPTVRTVAKIELALKRQAARRKNGSQ